MGIEYVCATRVMEDRLKAKWDSNAGDFIRFGDDYYSLMAVAEDDPIGLIVAKVRNLPEPLQGVQEAYIDVIEVLPGYRRQGIGSVLVSKAIAWAIENRASQIRAWSDEIRHEALMLWNTMGFTFSKVDFQRGDETWYGFYAAKRL